jgi:glycosyl-4,4'-diaponeurosporenoate acyltransferase
MTDLALSDMLVTEGNQAQEVVTMQIFFFNAIHTILIDIFAWVVFHLSIGYLSSKIPLEWLNPNRWLFQTFFWEKGGEIYQQLFRVRSWKKFIPNGSRLYRGAFSIRNLKTSDPAYLDRWLKESVRAEICHWVMILPGFLFFLWNNVFIGWIMVIYAFLNNLVPIIAQRFNRPRMRKFLAQLEKQPHGHEPAYGLTAA